MVNWKWTAGAHPWINGRSKLGQYENIGDRGPEGSVPFKRSIGQGSTNASAASHKA
jgi:hypothetical protein